MVEPEDLVGKLIEIERNKYLIDNVDKTEVLSSSICIPKFRVTLLAISQKEEKVEQTPRPISKIESINHINISQIQSDLTDYQTFESVEYIY